MESFCWRNNIRYSEGIWKERYAFIKVFLEGLKAKDSDRIRQRKEELEQELVEAEKGMKYYAV